MKTVIFCALTCISFHLCAFDLKPKPPSCSGVSDAHVFILAIGNNNYGDANEYTNSESDASSMEDFFREQFTKKNSAEIASINFHSYLLTGKNATKAEILKALADIEKKASAGDYFIFCFNGMSIQKKQANYEGTFFCPYDVIELHDNMVLRGTKDSTKGALKLFSLKSLNDEFDKIAAVNQLYIIEAGSSTNLNVEFTKASLLLHGSKALAAKNRIIIAPNMIGLDETDCGTLKISKGPINYVITSLDSSMNIYKIFSENTSGKRVGSSIKFKGFTCQILSFSGEYFDIYYEREFLKKYDYVSGNN